MKRWMACLLVFALLAAGMPVRRAAAEAPSVRRYTVLLLDVCGTHEFTYNGRTIYTATSAVNEVRTAAARFLDNIEAADGENRVCLITYAAEAKLVCGFTPYVDVLRREVAELTERDHLRNINGALAAAEEQLAAIDDPDAIRNIVIFTTGQADTGQYSDTGRYNSGTVGSSWFNTNTRIHIYRYSNSAIATAERIRNSGVTIYSIGLFQPFEGMPERGKPIAEFFRIVARDLASDENCFFNVEDPEELNYAFGTVAQVVADRLVRMTFVCSDEDRDFEETCYYSDMYFDRGASDWQPSLATMSLALALSAFGSFAEGYDDMSRNARRLMAGIGVPEEVIRASEGFGSRPGPDTIGAVAGWKKIHDGSETLIILAVRGGGYESEWASNLTVGTDGRYHQGFREARDQVLDFLKQYIADQGITGPVRIWIAGYSRAAAVTNLVGGAIDDGERLGSVTFTPQSDVYVYCFETPRGLAADGGAWRYRNIHNVINANDAVPMVAPEAWGFGVYGVRHELPTPETSGRDYEAQRAAMLRVYRSLGSIREMEAQRRREGKDPETYLVDSFKMKKIDYVKAYLICCRPLTGVILDRLQNLMEDLTSWDLDAGIVNTDRWNRDSQSVFLDRMLPAIFVEVGGDRKQYADEYQAAMREICGTLLGMNAQERGIFWSMMEEYKWELLRIAVFGARDEQGRDVRAEVLSGIIREWLRQAGVEGADSDALLASLLKMTGAFVPFAAKHPNDTVTLLGNLESIANAHYPQLCFAWLASADPNYGAAGGDITTDGRYRVIRINCPVDVRVLDGDGREIARIADGMPVDSGEAACVFGVDENGQKLVYLPANAAYDVRVTAAEDGTVSFGVSEYSRAAENYTRTVSYSDLPLKQGETLAASLPSRPSGSDDAALCTLTDGAGTVIAPTTDTADGGPRTVSVTVRPSHDRLGVTLGSGEYAVGAYVQAEAWPYDGCTFTGWESDGEIIGTESTLRLRADKPLTLTARFIGGAEICGAEGHQWADGVCTVCGERAPAGIVWLIVAGSLLTAAGIALIVAGLIRRRR